MQRELPLEAEQRLRDELAAGLMSQGLIKLKQLEAEKALQLARLPKASPSAKGAVKPKKEAGFWDWLGDLFSF